MVASVDTKGVFSICHKMYRLPILVIRRHESDSTHADFSVRRDKVMTTLQWLQQNNPYYKDITIEIMQPCRHFLKMKFHLNCLQLKKLEKRKLMMKTQKADILAIVTHSYLCQR